MKYKLNVKETGNKAAKFHYTITDENGVVISERKSNRVYVAATIDGSYYFGRLDLIGKGDHGKTVKWRNEWMRNPEWKNGDDYKNMYVPGSTPQTPIAYK